MRYVIHQLLRCAPLGYLINKDTGPLEMIFSEHVYGQKKHLPVKQMEGGIL